MTQIVPTLIFAAAAALAFGAQAASHVGAAPGMGMAASGSSMGASSPGKSAAAHDKKADKKADKMPMGKKEGEAK